MNCLLDKLIEQRCLGGLQPHIGAAQLGGQGGIAQGAILASQNLQALPPALRFLEPHPKTLARQRFELFGDGKAVAQFTVTVNLLQHMRSG